MLDVTPLLARLGFIKEFGIVIENRDHISPATVLTFEIILMSTIKGPVIYGSRFSSASLLLKNYYARGALHRRI